MNRRTLGAPAVYGQSQVLKPTGCALSCEDTGDDEMLDSHIRICYLPRCLRVGVKGILAFAKNYVASVSMT